MNLSFSGLKMTSNLPSFLISAEVGTNLGHFCLTNYWDGDGRRDDTGNTNTITTGYLTKIISAPEFIVRR
jgi:hypothetical protein